MFVKGDACDTPRVFLSITYVVSSVEPTLASEVKLAIGGSVLAWRKISAFRGDSSFKTWLLTIVWRQALDRRRARARWWQRSTTVSRSDDPSDDGLDRLVSHEADPERHAAARHRVRQVRDAITRLSPKLRDTLLLASDGEYSYEEIAEMLGVPLGTVKWRVSEARKLVQQRCEQSKEKP